MKKITIHTDGACEGNPGPGGWAAVLRYGGHARELSGGEPATSNNRMELQAAIAALQSLKEPCEVEFFTDSEYLRGGITDWVPRWKAKGWLRTLKKAVRNEDLWRRLDELAANHRVRWNWVKGHAGTPDNERCDVLARAVIAKIRRQFTPERLAALRAEFEKSRAAGKNQGELFN